MTRKFTLAAITSTFIAATWAPAASPTSVPAASQNRDLDPYILTPPAPPTPKINGAPVTGVRPGHPLLFTIAATGDRPMTFSADHLPSGLSLDPISGRITGILSAPGTFDILLHAKNHLGQTDRPLHLVAGDTIALTPPMGWNSYNCWGTQIDEQKVLESAKSMVASGLINHGWSYINMDDGWSGKRTGPLKALQPDPNAFPDMKRMCESIHQMGLKVGIYSSPWVVTYGGRLGSSPENPDGDAQQWSDRIPKNRKVLPFAIGKYHFIKNDADQYAQWGIDYLKYDWGPVELPETQEMADALHAVNRDIVFSLSNNHVGNLFRGIADVSKVANCWRTTTDITDNWKRVADDIGFNQDKWAPFQSPGHYNDPDMLVVGYVGWGSRQHPSRLTPDEQYTHISLWCLLSAPLLIGCDLDRLDAFTLNLLTNDEVLALDQDPLAKPAVTVAKQGDMVVYLKELADGTHAIGLFNRGKVESPCTARFADLKLTGPQHVHDLWRQKDLGVESSEVTATVPPHGVVLLKLAAQ